MLEKDDIYFRKYYCVYDTDLTPSAQEYLCILITFTIANRDIVITDKWLCAVLKCDRKTLQRARRNFQIRGLIYVEKTTGYKNRIILNKEMVNRFLGCKVFRNNTPSEKRGNLPTLEEIRKHEEA